MLPGIRGVLTGAVILCLILAGLRWHGPGGPSDPADRPLPQQELPDGPLRLTLLGTSLSALPPWPQEMADQLSLCLRHPVVLTNLSRPGATIRWGATQAGAVIDSQPHITLIEFAINDADLEHQLGLRQSRALHTDLIARLEAETDATVVLMTMSPAIRLRGLSRPFLAWHYGQYRTLAETLDLALIDLDPRWRSRPRADWGLAGDGLHPAHEVAAEVTIPAVTQALAAAFGQTCPAP